MAGNPTVAARMRRAATLMRQRGLTVGAFAGWEDAGRSASFAPRALIAHHTAAAIDVDRILRDGRADLPGPLCNWALHRDGSWWLVASGRANHAGAGWLPSSESFGVEATGPVPVTASGVSAFPNYDQYVLGVACICEVEGWTPGVVYGHKETALPAGRKIDPAFDMDRFRAQVKAKIGIPTVEDDLKDDERAALMWLRANATPLRDEGVRMTAMGDPAGPSDRTVNNIARLLAQVDDLATQVKVGFAATGQRLDAIEELVTPPETPA